jgi:tetratricopeptide (TPR) repeat protein
MTERARALFDRAMKVQPGFPWILHHHSLTYIGEGRPQEARAEIQHLLAAARESPDALLLAGQIAAALGDLSAARRYIERGFPEASSVWWKEQTGITLAWILQQAGDAERARQVLQGASHRFELRRRGLPGGREIMSSPPASGSWLAIVRGRIGRCR